MVAVLFKIVNDKNKTKVRTKEKVKLLRVLLDSVSTGNCVLENHVKRYSEKTTETSTYNTAGGTLTVNGTVELDSHLTEFS